VSLPTKLFANSSIPVSLWFVGRNRGESDHHRAREDETLFIDARKLGEMMPGSRRQRELLPGDIERIASAYHSFRNLAPSTPYADVEGFCRVASRADIGKQDFVLTPGRYVGTPESEEDNLPATERLELVRSRLLAELDESATIEQRLRGLLRMVHVDE
jgi:type I restriction enzyme M protein